MSKDVNALCVTLDGRVLSGSTDKSLCCWNVNTGDNITSGADVSFSVLLPLIIA
jgi:WD40 repeat protein